MNGVCSVCCFGDGDSFAYELNSNSFNDLPTIFPIYPPDNPALSIQEKLKSAKRCMELLQMDASFCESTILEKESDEVIKSSVKDLVPIPSEFEDTSESDSDCDLPSCEDFSPINIYKDKSVTFSNPLFDSNGRVCVPLDGDDESRSNEDVL
ncbi:hypothetical protein Tco_0063967 [Tanacetum coccineum]